MSFIKVAQQEISFVFNLAFVVRAEYSEKDRTLTIRFSDGETTTLNSDEAERVWDLLVGECELDHDLLQEAAEELETDETVDDFEQIKEEIADLEAQITEGTITRPWTAERLRNNAKDLGRYWSGTKKKELADDLKSIREKAYAVANQAEMTAYSSVIDQCMSAAFTTNASVISTLKRLTEAQTGLLRRKTLTPELKQRIRDAKERAASHRAKRKLQESQVAKAGGSVIKYEKYRREAEAILKQDWATIFPRERVPLIDSLEDRL
jgi:flagellin-like hook-associated protein FlgL